MKLTWTREQPSIEGYYFKRHTDLSISNPNFRVTVKVVYVGLDSL